MKYVRKDKTFEIRPLHKSQHCNAPAILPLLKAGGLLKAALSSASLLTPRAASEGPVLLLLLRSSWSSGGYSGEVRTRSESFRGRDRSWGCSSVAEGVAKVEWASRGSVRKAWCLGESLKAEEEVEGEKEVERERQG